MSVGVLKLSVLLIRHQAAKWERCSGKLLNENIMNMSPNTCKGTDCSNHLFERNFQSKPVSVAHTFPRQALRVMSESSFQLQRRLWHWVHASAKVLMHVQANILVSSVPESPPWSCVPFVRSCILLNGALLLQINKKIQWEGRSQRSAL